MLSFPFRLLTTIAIALFFSSKWVRRAVAAILVSTVIAVSQNQALMEALAGTGPGHQDTLLKALSAMAGG